MHPLRRLFENKVRRYRWEKGFWQLNVAAALYLFTFHRALWDEISVLYLVLVSIYALVLTAGGAAEAAGAAAKATEVVDNAN